MKHQHDDCSHNLKHCQKCDEAYCTKCDVTWDRGHYRTFPYPTWNPYDSIVLCDTTTGGTGNMITTTGSTFSNVATGNNDVEWEQEDHKHS